MFIHCKCHILTSVNLLADRFILETVKHTKDKTCTKMERQLWHPYKQRMLTMPNHLAVHRYCIL